MSSFMDWSVLDDETVRDIAKREAARVTERYTLPFWGGDDLLQEAHIILAGWEGTKDLIEQEAYGLIAFRLRQDLANRIATEAGRASKQVSRDQLVDEYLKGENQ